MATFERNQDGTVIVKLTTPIVFKGEELSRVTIPPLRGKHIKSCPFTLSELADVPIGKVVDFASRVVEPLGCVDEMAPLEAIEVGGELATMMGKSQGTGAAPSP